MGPDQIRPGWEEDRDMRRPRFQLTTRRLMAAVAIAGVVLGSGIKVERMWRLSWQYRMSADVCAGMEDLYRSDPRLARFYAQQKSRYERAAARPWLPVEPDPPPPE
jgi:hypothetical protein